MDRRIVSGIMGFTVVALSGGRAEAQRPSGFDPIAPIDRSINAGTTPSPSTGVQPPTPDTAGPVSMTPVPQIGRSINAGKVGEPAPSFGLSGLFRRARPRAASTAIGRVTPAQAVPPIAPSWTRSPAPAPDSAGRPAPYANQAPAAARPQADPTTIGTEGRPAPSADDRPGRARPRASADAPTPAPRPRPPVAEPDSATPAVPSTLPPLEAEAPRSSVVPPAGTDPLAGMESIAPVAPEPVVAAAPPPESQAQAQAPADPQVMQTSGEATAMKIKEEPPRKLSSAGRRAASVGDEIITLHELNMIVLDKYREITQGQEVSKEQKSQILNSLAAQALDALIEQAVILQEAGRVMGKNPKSKEQFLSFVVKKWTDDELPPMLRKNNVSNVFELKKLLTSQGKDYDDIFESYRKMMMAREFQMMKIRDKISADLPEQKAYYLEHLHDFDQPARFSFREIEIKVETDRAAARNKAEAIKARLAREDFADLARSDSQGPTAKEGGLYADMAPGGYGIPSVNDQLNRLPVGKVSEVIEAPNSFHIVRVETRRDAGPLRFDEVQPKVHEAVFERNFMKARGEFVAGLRSKTLIRTMFDNTESDPNRARRPTDAAVRPASNR